MRSPTISSASSAICVSMVHRLIAADRLDRIRNDPRGASSAGQESAFWRRRPAADGIQLAPTELRADSRSQDAHGLASGAFGRNLAGDLPADLVARWSREGRVQGTPRQGFLVARTSARDMLEARMAPLSAGTCAKRRGSACPGDGTEVAVRNSASTPSALSFAHAEPTAERHPPHLSVFLFATDYPTPMSASTIMTSSRDGECENGTTT